MYADYGYPFFEIWEESSSVSGDFENVKSIGQIDKVVEPKLKPKNVLRIGQFPKFFNRRTGSSTTVTTDTPVEPIRTSGNVGAVGLKGGETGNMPEVKFFQDPTGLPTFRSMQELERHMA
jgi:hypothetical protein